MLKNPISLFLNEGCGLLSLERIFRALVSLGLSELEARVYVFLAKKGPCKERDIAESLKLYKKQLYRSLKTLQDKDVVRATGAHPHEFSATSFEEVLELLLELKKEQTKSLEASKAELISDLRTEKKKSNASN